MLEKESGFQRDLARQYQLFINDLYKDLRIDKPACEENFELIARKCRKKPAGEKGQESDSMRIILDHFRVIIAPDPELKQEQEDILRILENIPMHKAAFGCIKGKRPIRCAEAHLDYWGITNREENDMVVLKADVKNFFPSTSSKLVGEALLANGVEPAMKNHILRKCCTKVDSTLACKFVELMEGYIKRMPNLSGPAMQGLVEKTDLIRTILNMADTSIEGQKAIYYWCQMFVSYPSLERHKDGWHYSFLCQGAPTSPLLANLSFKLMDYRLGGLAKWAGAFYTRYVDDMNFSWKGRQPAAKINGLYIAVRMFLKDIGYKLNDQKKAVMGQKKTQKIVGYVLNSGRPTVSRKYRDMVKDQVKKFPGKIVSAVERQEEAQKLFGKIAYVATAHPDWAEILADKLKEKSELFTERHLDMIADCGEVMDPADQEQIERNLILHSEVDE
jgi:hypothetical protein